MPSTVAEVLSEDAADRAWNRVFLPTLVAQFLLYLVAAGRFARDPGYSALAGASAPELHENHLGNIAIVLAQPDRALLAVHLGMAVFWVGGVLGQKALLRAMSASLADRDGPSYRRARNVHAVLGTALVAVALAGCVAGPIIAWQSHGHPAMKAFLLALPLYFLPAITMVWVSARRRRLADHRFWATAAFVGPAVASLWAEALIYVCGRHTPLGPWTGELVGTGSAFALSAWFVVRPAIVARRAQLA